ncbi:MAG TPA: hypothetical protein VFA34_14050 [Actinomycetota bacterium]|jgi:hypothetical protein|nr:hypothetical protein [Actinomycetota bacterium]
MLWAALVAGGVAIVSMAIFGARLTRKPEPDPHDDLVASPDPDDPWAAWRPRPIEELDSPPRPRLWPVLASLTGLVLVGGGLAGARQTFEKPETLAADTEVEPYQLEVTVTPSPTPVPTPASTPRKVVATAKPQAAAPKPAAAAPGGPSVSGSASCTDRKAKVSFVITTSGTQLKWVGVYLDKKVVGGGSQTSTRYEGGVERSTTPGAHEFEVSAEDKAGKTTRKQWQVNCA